MLRKLYYLFGIIVIIGYSGASLLGWEFLNSGKYRSTLGIPFISSGYRGGK